MIPYEYINPDPRVQLWIKEELSAWEVDSAHHDEQKETLRKRRFVNSKKTWKDVLLTFVVLQKGLNRPIKRLAMFS